MNYNKEQKVTVELCRDTITMTIPIIIYQNKIKQKQLNLTIKSTGKNMKLIKDIPKT